VLVGGRLREIGILSPNNQRQHHTGRGPVARERRLPAAVAPHSRKPAAPHVGSESRRDYGELRPWHYIYEGRRGLWGTPREPLSLPQRLISYCRTASASTAPCKSRRMCCPTCCANFCAPCQPLLACRPPRAQPPAAQLCKVTPIILHGVVWG